MLIATVLAIVGAGLGFVGAVALQVALEIAIMPGAVLTLAGFLAFLVAIVQNPGRWGEARVYHAEAARTPSRSGISAPLRAG